MQEVLLAPFYWSCISWFRIFSSAEKPVLDVHEHYQKQTWRNRCRIIGPNGVQDLVIPVHFKNHMPLHEVRIDYSSRWQQQHWRAIQAGYGQSPFFAHYENKIAPLYAEQKFEKLVDFDVETLRIALDLLKVKKEWTLSGEFLPYTENDPRLTIHPKKKSMEGKRYPQVFEERHGFIADASILDLLFCCGPAATDFL